MAAATPADDMTCKEVVELVTAYLDGALPADDRRRFDAHLAACDGCTEYLRQMRLTIAAAGELREAAIPDATLSELQKAFRSFKR